MNQEFKALKDELNNIPLVDEDAQEIEESEDENSRVNDKSYLPYDPSFDSICSNDTDLDNSNKGLNTLDSDLSPDEIEEKERLVQQVLELQNTLDDLSLRVDNVKEENLKLKSENQVLGQYIENLMSASSVFQSTSPKASKKKTKR